MEVQKLNDGLWRWTGLHPDWTPAEGGPEGWEREVGCVYCEADDAVVLVDPLVPPEDRDRFWAALDRDVERAGRPVHVLLTVFWHARSAREIADRYGGEIWAHEQVLKLDQREVEPTRTFAFGDALPGGVDARDAARLDEAVFWLPRHRALVFGDVVLGAADGVRLCPASWRSGSDDSELKEALRPLLQLPVELLLVSHDQPVLEGGREALARALSGETRAPSG
jgi:glyoxylase-like metal-dependent hydrolase (beta-lactamase superfamily II)